VALPSPSLERIGCVLYIHHYLGMTGETGESMTRGSNLRQSRVFNGVCRERTIAISLDIK
jgi:hypothetical protein